MNREQRYGAYMGLMIGLLLPLLFASLGGCATTAASYATADKTVTWKSRTVWKDIESVEVEWGDLKTSLGSSTNNEAVACILAPKLCR